MRPVTPGMARQILLPMSMNVKQLTRRARGLIYAARLRMHSREDSNGRNHLSRCRRSLGHGARVTARRGAPVPARGAADDALVLRLDDLPRIQESMDIEALKPSLLSRMLDLFAPVKGTARG